MNLIYHYNCMSTVSSEYSQTSELSKIDPYILSGKLEARVVDEIRARRTNRVHGTLGMKGIDLER